MSTTYPVLSYYARNEHFEKEFLLDLQKRRIDEKFHYIGKRQANSWFNICNSPEYEYYRESKKLLEDSIHNFIADHKGDVNVIALGPGDALKENVVVNAFLKQHRVSLFFVDVSREILNVAIKNAEDSAVLKEVFIADLMNFTDIKSLSQYVKKQYYSTNFFTLLGNTLGNYPQAMILKTIRDAMTPGDKILIDVSVKKAGSIKEEAAQINTMVQAYKNPSGIERVLASLSDAHIEETDGDIEVEFSVDELFPQMGAVKQFFCFSRSKVITYHGQTVYFAKGERILVGYSNKYTFETLENILSSHGLRIVQFDKDTTGEIHQLLCELA